MSILKFDLQEIEIIKNSIELMKKNIEKDTKYQDLLNLILSKLEIPIIDLKPKEKSVIKICVNEFQINKNQKFIQMSDYEIMLCKDQIEKKCLELDVVFGLLKKLTKNSKSDYRFFKTIFDKIDKICDSKEIYYSISNNGKIYKVGIVTGQNRGIKTELGNLHSLKNFFFETLNKDSFMKTGKPNEILDYIEWYEMKNKLYEGHVRLKEVLKIIIDS